MTAQASLQMAAKRPGDPGGCAGRTGRFTDEMIIAQHCDNCLSCFLPFCFLGRHPFQQGEDGEQLLRPGPERSTGLSHPSAAIRRPEYDS